MISVYYLELADYINDHHVLHVDSIYNRHFLPFGRTDLTTSASLQPICGSSLQLHGPLPSRCDLNVRVGRVGS